MNPARIAKYYVRWLVIATITGVLCGTASAFFLIILDATTQFREHHIWFLYLLPVGGLIVGLCYHHYGRTVEGGNNLVIDQFHDPTKVIPFRMAPLVLFGTLVTHLFGGSAGREGTAVQMGASISDQLTHFFKISREERRTLLMAGMSGGFGSVFGVPFAGTLFGLEVLAVGRLHLWALFECAIAAFVAHYVTLFFGVHHTAYPTPAVPALTLIGAGVAIGSGFIFGAAARIFARTSDFISKFSKRLIPYLPLRAAVGGAIIAVLYFTAPILIRYAGLGVALIIDSLKAPLPLYDWFGKLMMTALTLGTGFKGGEVTPLLFVGSTLGNAIAQILPAGLQFPLPILACMGFVAVFAGAANTPLACTVMAMELFGPGIFIYALLACLASYAVSGHHGIYHSQRILVGKSGYASRTSEFLHELFRRPPLKYTQNASEHDLPYIIFSF